MREEYDVAVVGGGPAGSTVAKFAAMGGASVAVFEKDREIGIPVRCGETTSLNDLSKYIEINDKWIADVIDRARIVSPSGKIVDLILPVKGVVLHRRLFDSALAAEAASEGAEIYTKAYVRNVTFTKNDYSYITVSYLGKDRNIRAKIVIAADGVESRIARFAGIHTQCKLIDMESCAQIYAGNVDIEPSRVDFYFSSEWAPGGYIWVFPKGKNVANIGLGINCARIEQRSAIECLEDFIKAKYPSAVRLAITAGGVPVANTLKKLVADGLMIVGDAARMVNAVTGGGILPAIASGKMAGEIAAKSIKNGDNSADSLMEYQKLWENGVGKDYRRYYKVKEWIVSLTDEYLDSIADVFRDVPPEKVTLLNLFKAAVKEKPSLIIDVIKLYAAFG